MKHLFRFFRFCATGAILFILLMSLGYADWRTWVVYVLTYVAMFCDFAANAFDDEK